MSKLRCTCIDVWEERNEKSAKKEAEFMHSKYGYKVIVVKNEVTPFRTEYKILGNPHKCKKHRFFVLFLIPSKGKVVSRLGYSNKLIRYKLKVK